MSSPQSYQARAMGAEGAPIFVNSTISPITGSFYLISIASQCQIGHLHTSNISNLTGQQFAAGYPIGGTHTVVHLNSGTAIAYGSQNS